MHDHNQAQEGGSVAPAWEATTWCQQQWHNNKPCSASKSASLLIQCNQQWVRSASNKCEQAPTTNLNPSAPSSQGKSTLQSFWLGGLTQCIGDVPSFADWFAIQSTQHRPRCTKQLTLATDWQKMWQLPWQMTLCGWKFRGRGPTTGGPPQCHKGTF